MYIYIYTYVYIYIYVYVYVCINLTISKGHSDGVFAHRPDSRTSTTSRIASNVCGRTALQEPIIRGGHGVTVSVHHIFVTITSHF